MGQPVPDLDLPPSSPPPAGWRRTFRALRHRNYRLFISGQSVSQVGSWMQRITQNWLVYRLSGSEFLVGAVGFCANVPVLLIGPIGGITADRHSRYRILLAAQTLLLLQAAALATLTLTGAVTVRQIFLLALVWGVVTAFEIPARQALFIHMVGKEDLFNAITLNSVSMNAARILGPAVAGVLIATFGEGLCFTINAVTFLAVIISLLLMRLPAAQPNRAASPWIHLREGFRYVGGNRPVLSLLLVNSAVSIARSPSVALAPFFADAIFGRGAEGLGALMGAAGIGAVCGTLGLATRTDTRGLPRTVLNCVLISMTCLALFAWSPSFWLSLGFFLLIGYAHMRQSASVNTLVQSLIPDEYRGRVMSLYSMTAIGSLPFGQLAGGAIAEEIGVRWTVFLGAMLCLAAALAFRRTVAGIERSLEVSRSG